MLERGLDKKYEKNIRLLDSRGIDLKKSKPTLRIASKNR